MPLRSSLLAGLLVLTALSLPAQDANALFARGREQMRQRDFVGAAQTFEKAVAAAPSEARLHQWYGRALGLSLQGAGVFKAMAAVGRVRTSFEKAVQLEPENADAREDLANFYLSAPGIVGGGRDKARAQIEELRRRDGYKAALLDGELAANDKRWDEARAAWRRAAAIAPTRAEPFVRISRVEQQQQRWDEAFAAAERAVKLEPRGPSALYVLGRAAASSGQRLDRGEAALRTFLTVRSDFDEPSPAAGHFRLGGVLEKKGDVAGARAAYETALRLDSKFKEVRAALDKLRKS
ncbi:MAG: tetratricopeptide repeat protein [Verrucomicrobia bacterium]|nr:tetratricopeptide repeat protein [Verrucomicrobiota bacterium]